MKTLGDVLLSRVVAAGSDGELAPLPVVAVLALLFGFAGVAAGVAIVGAWLVVDLLAVLADDAGRSPCGRLAGTVVVQEALATVSRVSNGSGITHPAGRAPRPW
jgi:hypothetical protein